MKHAIAAVLICAALPFVVQAKADANEAIPRVACPTEDSTNCVWDAKHRGNGKGRSYIAFADGTILPIRHHWAHKLTHKG